VRLGLVVVSLPLQDLALCVSDGEERLDVEMLVAPAAVEVLDDRIVHRLARPAEDQPDPVLVGPGVRAPRAPSDGRR